MSKGIVKISVVILLVSFCVSLHAQYRTKSPYSLYGVGELFTPQSSQTVGFGGFGLTLRDKNQINLLNPASYTAEDTMSFIFDVGANYKKSDYETNTDKSSLEGINLDHLTVAFPISRKLNMVLGVSPFSSVGFYTKEVGYSAGVAEDTYYEGNGGFNRFTIGAAYKISDKFSVGINADYIFGAIRREINTVTPYESNSFVIKDDQKIIAKDFLFTLGAQYDFTLNEKSKLRLGLTFRPGMDLKTKVTRVYSTLSGGTSIDTTLDESSNIDLKMPMRIGAGIALVTDKMLIGLDYINEDWASYSVDGKKDSLKSINNFHLGIQFTPERNSPRYYWKRIDYRVGVKYGNSYLNLKGEDLYNYGIAFGLGLPTRGYSRINIGFEFGKMGTTSQNLIEENYGIISFGLSLYDMWFFKRKID